MYNAFLTKFVSLSIIITFYKNPSWDVINPLSPVSDQDRISPYYIYTKSCRQVMRIEKNINYGITHWSDTKFSKLAYWESFGRQ